MANADAVDRNGLTIMRKVKEGKVITPGMSISESA